MSTQGQQLKFFGMSLAAAKRNADLEEARAYLVKLAVSRPDRTVTADDAQCFSLGNAAGSLFRCPEWEFTGSWVPSRNPSNHSHYNRVWRLK